MPRFVFGNFVKTWCELDNSLKSGFIIGGEKAKIGEFPFMALLGYDNTFNRKKEFVYKCGGSLINRRYVLTAAHCHDLEKGQLISEQFCWSSTKNTMNSSCLTKQRNDFTLPIPGTSKFFFLKHDLRLIDL